MATTFIPTRAADLKRGDLLGAAQERVLRDAVPCSLHGGVFFEIEGYDTAGRYNGIHSDMCVDANAIFVRRYHMPTHVQIQAKGRLRPAGTSNTVIAIPNLTKQES